MAPPGGLIVTFQLKRKSVRLAALEKQLQEKTSAYSQAAMKNSELEKEQLVHTYTHPVIMHTHSLHDIYITKRFPPLCPQEKASSIQHYQSVMTKKQREFQQALEKCKKAHSEQNKELQDRVEVVCVCVVSLYSVFTPLSDGYHL